MKVALLALQGDFAEHEAVFRALGAETLQLRQKKDLEQHFDALILPGGESTVQGKLLRELEMFEPLKEMIEQGMPVLATCAGVRDVPMSFIRAPQIEFCGSGCEVLAEHEGRITAVRQGNQLAMTFHPELCDDHRVAQYFLSEIVGMN